MSVSNKDDKNTYVRLDTGGENFTTQPAISQDFISLSLKNKISLELFGIKENYTNTMVEVFSSNTGAKNLVNATNSTALFQNSDQSYYYQNASHKVIESNKMLDVVLKPKSMVVSEIVGNTVSLSNKSRVEVSLNDGLNWAFTNPLEYKYTDELLKTENLPISVDGHSKVKIKMYINPNIIVPVGVNTWSLVNGLNLNNCYTSRNEFEKSAVINKNNIKAYGHSPIDFNDGNRNFAQYDYITNVSVTKASFNQSGVPGYERYMANFAGDSTGFSIVSAYIENVVGHPTLLSGPAGNFHGFYSYQTDTWSIKASIPITRYGCSGGSSGTTSSFISSHGFKYNSTYHGPEGSTLNALGRLGIWWIQSRYLAPFAYLNPSLAASQIDMFEYSAYKYNGTSWSSIADNSIGIAAESNSDATSADNLYMSLVADAQPVLVYPQFGSTLCANTNRFQHFNGTTWSLKSYEGQAYNLPSTGYVTGPAGMAALLSSNSTNNAISIYGKSIFSVSGFTDGTGFGSYTQGYLAISEYNSIADSWAKKTVLAQNCFLSDPKRTDFGSLSFGIINSIASFIGLYYASAYTSTTTPNNVYTHNLQHYGFGALQIMPYSFKYNFGTSAGIKGFGVKLNY